MRVWGLPRKGFETGAARVLAGGYLARRAFAQRAH
jgi:hypothetical protein